MPTGSTHEGPEALNHSLESGQRSPFCQASVTERTGTPGKGDCEWEGSGLRGSPLLGSCLFLSLRVSQATSRPSLPPRTVWATVTMPDAWAAPGLPHGNQQLEFLDLNP